MIQQRCCPTEITGIKRLAGNVDHPIDTTHRCHVAQRCRLGRMLPQSARVAIEPAHIALVNRLDIVADRSVITVGVPGLFQRRWHGEVLGDLDAGVTLVELAQGLVMQIGIEIALQAEEFHDALAAPGGPVVRGERDIGAISEGVDGLGQIPRPRSRVTHQCAPQSQQIMQIVGGILGHAQRPELRKVEVHFGRRLSPGCHLKLNLDTINDVHLTGGGDVQGRHDDRDLAGRGVLPESAPDLAARAPVEQGSVHIGSPPGHRRARVDVLLHGMCDEAFRRQYRDRAGVHIGLGRHAQHAAEVIDVTVGVDHRDDRPVTAVGAVQRQGGGRGFGADQWIDHDDPGITFDEGDVGQVQAADLIDTFDHFVEALFGSQCGLTPQAGMDAGRSGVAQEGIRIVVPDHSSIGGLDDAGFQSAQESPVGVLEVAAVIEGQR